MPLPNECTPLRPSTAMPPSFEKREVCKVRCKFSYSIYLLTVYRCLDQIHFDAVMGISLSSRQIFSISTRRGGYPLLSCQTRHIPLSNINIYNKYIHYMSTTRPRRHKTANISRMLSQIKTACAHCARTSVNWKLRCSLRHQTTAATSDISYHMMTCHFR